MKTMRNSEKVVRVKEGEVETYLSRGYDYCPKSVWIKEVRDVGKKKDGVKKELADDTTKRGKNSDK